MYLLINNIRHKEEKEYPFNKNFIPKDLNFSKIIKTTNSIKCYLENKLYCTFEGIKNWDIYSVENGKFTEEITKEEKLLLVNQQLSKQINDLLIENKKNKEINKILAQQINNINIKLNSRGDK